MKVASKQFLDQELLGGTRTVTNLGSFLGKRATNLGIVGSMYPNHSATFLIEQARNTYSIDKGKAEAFKPIMDTAVEWELDVHSIKQVTIARSLVGNQGARGAVFSIFLKEGYFHPHDTFALENNQLLFVKRMGEEVAPNVFEYKVELVSSSDATTTDPEFTAQGRTTRYISNFHSEISYKGYTKYTYNTEIHRNYISRHRSSGSWSQEYKNKEVYFTHPDKKNEKSHWFKCNKVTKDVLDSLMSARENNILSGQTNYDANGKCRTVGDDKQDIPMGDGIIAQLERAADIYAFSTFTLSMMQQIISAMNEKAVNIAGNHYIVKCNSRLYEIFQREMLADHRFNSPNDNTLFYSKDAGKKINIGAEFASYSFAGNTLTFLPNKVLGLMYPDSAYGFFLNISPDGMDRPNLAGFTIKGLDMVTGHIDGLGQQSGNSSGVISSSVTASEFHAITSSGVAIFNTDQSFIMRENRN